MGFRAIVSDFGAFFYIVILGELVAIVIPFILIFGMTFGTTGFVAVLTACLLPPAYVVDKRIRKGPGGGEYDDKKFNRRDHGFAAFQALVQKRGGEED